MDYYIRSLEAADAAWEELTVSGKPAFTIANARGELVTNPVWRAWREAKASANTAAGELGLTWKARQAMGDPTVPTTGNKFGL